MGVGWKSCGGEWVLLLIWLRVAKVIRRVRRKGMAVVVVGWERRGMGKKMGRKSGCNEM